MKFDYEKTIQKPWGKEEIISLCPKYCFKKITLNEGFKTSLQYHEYKKETIYIISGKAGLIFQQDGHTTSYKTIEQGDCVTIYPNEVHQVCAIKDCVYLEASSPEVWDVVRLEDAYGREGTSEE